MGQEKETTLRLDGKTLRGKALLETDEIIFRGERRIVIALKSITTIDVAAGKLRLTYPEGVAELDLGAQAETWATRIRSPKGRLDKLGVTPESDVVLIGSFDDALRPELAGRSCNVTTRTRASGGHALILFAVDTKAALGRIPTLRASLADDGALWIVYPKGKKEIRESDVLEAGRAAKMTDHKVARFSETHTGLKFVIPPALRKSTRKA